MPRFIKILISFLIGTMGWVALAHAADAPSLAEHSDALLLIIVGLVTILNAWAGMTFKDIKQTIKEISTELSGVKERLSAVEASCRIRHHDEEGT